MIRQEEVYKIGKIGKPHGVKGELTLFFDDDVFDRVDADYLVLLIDGILVPFYMEEWRFKSGETALVKFEDIDTKEEASEIVGSEVYFPKHLSDRGDDELTWDELKGFSLADDNMGGTALIPASEDIIVDVDAGKKLLRAKLPEGLIDINDNN